MKLAIVGGPGTGKTTLAGEVSAAHPEVPVVHGDDFQGMDWSQQSEVLAEKCNRMEHFIVEGTSVARALRKGLKVDRVVYLTQAHKPLTTHQRAMAAGIETVFNEMLDAGKLRGIKLQVK